MNATVARVQGRHDRAFLWAVLISLALHAVLFVPGVRDTFESVRIDMEPAPPPEPMEFTLVSPPETPTPTDRESPFRSTVDSEASDSDPDDTQSRVPRSDGRFPIPDTPAEQEGADGGGKAELPPLPTEESDLTEAIHRSKFTSQMSPSHTPSLPDETMDFAEEGSASASIGGIQLNTTAWDFAPYLLDLKRRIKQKWIPPIAFTSLGAVHGYTWVRFRIYPDGHMQALEVIETEGHGSLHKSSENAVKGAAPFRELPQDFPEDYLEIEFGFYYLLPGDEKVWFKNGRFLRKGDPEERSDP